MNIPGCKGGRCVRLTTSPPSRAGYHEIWEPEPPGTLWAYYGTAFLRNNRQIQRPDNGGVNSDFY